MSFYKDIAPYYDKLFPLKMNKVEFFASLFHDNNVEKVMDLACGAGDLACALAARGFWVIGVDEEESLLKSILANVNPEIGKKVAKPLSEGMNSEASKNSSAACRAKAGNAEKSAGPAGRVDQGRMPEFVVSRMEALAFARRESLDAILCLGNSLPHLGDDGLIREVLLSCAVLLCHGGVMCVQMINFDMVRLKGQVRLPDLVYDNVPGGKKVTLKRIYKVDDRGAVFAPELVFGKRVRKYEIRMYPLGYERLCGFLRESGLDEQVTFADYSGNKFEYSNLSFIAIAKKSGAY